MDNVGRIADEVVDGQDPGARLRIGKVTEVDPVRSRVRLDITGPVWLNADVSMTLIAGDRVYAFMQGPTGVVAGKLSGSTGTPVGSVTAYAGTSTTVPNGWLLCQGQAVSRATYSVLFDRIGTSYGAGDGATTFNVPNLTGRFPMGEGGTRARGATGGAETVALTLAQMPAHNHGSDGAHTHSSGSHTHAQDDVADGTTAGVADMPASSTVTSSSAGAHTHNTEGSGAAHENLPPFVVLYYIIRAI